MQDANNYDVQPQLLLLVGGLKMQDRNMEDQKMEDRKLQDQVLARKMQE